MRQRARAGRLGAKGDTLDQIADVLAVGRDAVSRTLDRWEHGGVAAREEGHRAGRRPKGDAGLEAQVLAAHALGRGWQPPGPALAALERVRLLARRRRAGSEPASLSRRS